VPKSLRAVLTKDVFSLSFGNKKRNGNAGGTAKGKTGKFWGVRGRKGAFLQLFCSRWMCRRMGGKGGDQFPQGDEPVRGGNPEAKRGQWVSKHKNSKNWVDDGRGARTLGFCWGL